MTALKGGIQPRISQCDFSLNNIIYYVDVLIKDKAEHWPEREDCSVA
jgi:hypothetical protein